MLDRETTRLSFSPHQASSVSARIMVYKPVLDERTWTNSPKLKTDNTLIRRINWFHVFWLLFVPLIGFLAATHTPLQLPTAIWAVAYYFITALGITAGTYSYHSVSCRRAIVPRAYQHHPLTIPNLSFRLPQTVGSPLLHRVAPVEDMACSCRRRHARRLDPRLVRRPPCAPPVH